MFRLVFKFSEFFKGLLYDIHKWLVIAFLRFNWDIRIKKFAVILLNPIVLLGLVVLGCIFKSPVYYEKSIFGEPQRIERRITSSASVSNSSAVAQPLLSVVNIDQLITEYCRKYNIEPSLVKALIKVESNFNPNAVSKRGACGIMQLDMITQQELGIEDPFVIEDNIEAGIRYLRILLDRYDNDMVMALAAYNAGPSKVRRYRGIPPYKETQRHIKRVLYYYHKYKSLDTKREEIAYNFTG